MRHRKKFMIAALLLAVAYAALWLWPHSNPQAVRALAAMRRMIEPEPNEAAPLRQVPQPADDVQIQLCCILATINMTDATAGLFAEPGQPGGPPYSGRLKSQQQFMKTGQAVGAIQIASMPMITALPGQRAVVSVGSSVPALEQNDDAACRPEIHYRDVGIFIDITPRFAADQAIDVEFSCEMSQIGRTRAVVTDQGAMDIPDVHALTAKARSVVKPGETLIIGGLSQKRWERTLVRIPLLGELPAVGDWFSFTRQRQIEEELVILVTPSVVNAVAKQ